VAIADDEDDDEILLRSPPSHAPQKTVIYDIVHSPSYQVPVLYIHFSAESRPGLPKLDEVRDLLVPPSHRQQIDAVGVMGALSMTDHPVTGLPSYFVHPCRSQEAMANVTTGRPVRPDEYMLLWLGLIGQSVGLNAPLELGRSLGNCATENKDA